MRRTKRRDKLCACLLCLNLVFIWGNSMMPGEVSSRISQWVGEILSHILGLPAGEAAEGHGLLRKIAHFSEFACLGLLLCWHLGMAGRSGKDLAALTLLGGLVAACVDETIQIFVDGRASSLIDVWIDTCGAVTGMIFLILGYHLIRAVRGKKNLEETI